MVEIKIDAKNLKRYLEISGCQVNILSITLLKAYVGLHRKRGAKDKAHRLIARMQLAVTKGRVSRSDKFASKLNEAFETLKTFVESKDEVMTVSRAELNGLGGITGENLFSQKKVLS